MILNLPNEHNIDVTALERDLFADGFDLKAISQTGELVIESTNDPEYAYRREVWQARQDGEGADNTHWGDLPGGYEFCRTIKLD